MALRCNQSILSLSLGLAITVSMASPFVAMEIQKPNPNSCSASSHTCKEKFDGDWSLMQKPNYNLYKSSVDEDHGEDSKISAAQSEEDSGKHIISVLGKSSDTSFGSLADTDSTSTSESSEVNSIADSPTDQMKKDIDKLKDKTDENEMHIQGNDRRNTLMMDDNERRIDALEKKLQGGITDNSKKITVTEKKTKEIEHTITTKITTQESHVKELSSKMESETSRLSSAIKKSEESTHKKNYRTTIEGCDSRELGKGTPGSVGFQREDLEVHQQGGRKAGSS